MNLDEPIQLIPGCDSVATAGCRNPRMDSAVGHDAMIPSILMPPWPHVFLSPALTARNGGSENVI